METPPSTPPFAVITGASRGIGAEYARALAGRGYDLLLVSRDTARMDQLASELTSCHGVAVDSEELDLAQEDAGHRLYVAARQRRPHVDLLVNNAGFGLSGEFVNMPMARVQAMLRLHVITIVESIRLFLPAMLERRDGGVITVASIAGFYSVPYMAEYAATKAFLIAFSEALAEEVASSGVRVQACCPGSTETDFHATAGLTMKMSLVVDRMDIRAISTSPAVQSGRYSPPMKSGWIRESPVRVSSGRLCTSKSGCTFLNADAAISSFALSGKSSPTRSVTISRRNVRSSSITRACGASLVTAKSRIRCANSRWVSSRSESGSQRSGFIFTRHRPWKRGVRFSIQAL